MKRNNIIIGIVGIALVIITIYALSGGQSPEEYAAYIEDERNDVERYMQSSDESPFVSDNVPFTALNYYPADLEYKINARFEKTVNPQIINLATSDGKENQYLTYGHAYFKLDGVNNRLLILEDVKENKLFLPFGDATSATETYGAGRYLDVTHSGGATITLDFNLAYNPYCAYSENYSCPLPPKENLLSIPIKAGEKKYTH